ncbi:hypothetical protein BKP45_10655 [Anaerobacillus alkalidiazotrophicus]|uniref:Uncharacterized protein n=1 Tax=Anaerobacillus alkalidiazotrophicus TaxID=472963 RepID=A0A1S2M4Z6_9BACI|nr:hypothetical protein [Anaerobacillus alkalidiazotrophicus]OIJ18054.1 hypothetical protein BKP45_16370 [Anaerobacillus alkalidiazotrophicus]OIJ19533.1 hypothetical protein BKP45_10655 [Anaerobacillus alkalidiazotrophicus]
MNEIKLTKKENQFLEVVLDKLIMNGVKEKIINDARNNIYEQVRESRVKNEDPLIELGDPEEMANEYLKITSTNKSNNRWLPTLIFIAIMLVFSFLIRWFFII